MVASNGRRWSNWAAAALLAVLSQTGTGVSAAASRVGGMDVQCGMAVRTYLQRAPVMRRSDEQIVRLLDAGRYQQADSALRNAVSQYPDAWAGYALGNLYAAGLGVPRDAGSAFHWYLWSAERGNRFAQRQVANAYLDGDGTKRNAAGAAYWFRIGIAPFQLAKMYDSLSETYARGRLAPVNRAKAGYYLDKGLSELRELAREPNGEAAYYLGLAYERGQGVPRDRAKAVRYLCRAAALQYGPAVAAIGRLRGP